MNLDPRRTSTRVCVSLAILSVVASVAHAEPTDWWQFRGPTGMGVAESSELPLEWSEQQIVWKTSLPGSGASSPVVWNDHVYLTAYSGHFVPDETDGGVENLKRHLLAINRSNGEIIWSVDVAAKLPEEDRIRDHGYAANTAAADRDRVYAFLGKSGVFAFDHDGNQLWQADVGSNTRGWGTGASLVLYDDLVIVNASVESEALIALDKTNGKEVWRAEDVREAWNTPIIVNASSGRDELIVARIGEVLAFAPKTGMPLWTCQTDITWYMVPTAVADENTVYFLGGRSGIAALAVRTGGSGDVTETHRKWTSMTGSNVTSPLLKDGHLYWMSEKNGTAYCAIADTGELVYQERIARAGQIYASPILAGDRVYYVSRNGTVFVVAATPQFNLLATNRIDDRSRFDASPAVDGNRLLLRSEKYLYCIGH